MTDTAPESEEAASPAVPSSPVISAPVGVATIASSSSDDLTSLSSSPDSVPAQAVASTLTARFPPASLKRKNLDLDSIAPDDATDEISATAAGAGAGSTGRPSLPALKRPRQAPSPKSPSAGGGKKGGPGRARGGAAQRPQRRSKVGGEKARPTWKAGKRVNIPPTMVHEVYVLGEVTDGALGLGPGSTGADDSAASKPVVARALCLNANVAAETVGVVQIACGAAHVVALTRDNRILTWGRNEWGALGRSTESEEHSADERKPTPVDSTGLSPLIRWAQVVATDSASFALTEDGKVFGWGAFIGNDGLMGFSESVRFQETPTLVPGLHDIRQLAAGGNHVLALDGNGAVRAWGAGELSQLARKVLHSRSRSGNGALRPAGVNIPRTSGAVKIIKVACGRSHSFALNDAGLVFAWGLNYFAELGFGDGVDNGHATSRTPVIVDGLRGHTIVDAVGGENHSAALTSDGKVLVWGRVDGYQSGLPSEVFNAENAFFDERGKARFLRVPTLLPGLPPISYIAAGRDHTIAITKDGEVYTWGQSMNFQTGSETRQAVRVPTLLSIPGKMMASAIAGDEFSILVAERPDLVPVGDDTAEVDVLALGAAQGYGSGHHGVTHPPTWAKHVDEKTTASQPDLEESRLRGAGGQDRQLSIESAGAVLEEAKAAVDKEFEGGPGEKSRDAMDEEMEDMADEELKDTTDEEMTSTADIEVEDASEEEDAQDPADDTVKDESNESWDATPLKPAIKNIIIETPGTIDQASPAGRLWATLTGLATRVGARRTG